MHTGDPPIGLPNLVTTYILIFINFFMIRVQWGRGWLVTALLLIVGTASIGITSIGKHLYLIIVNYYS